MARSRRLRDRPRAHVGRGSGSRAGLGRRGLRLPVLERPGSRRRSRSRPPAPGVDAEPAADRAPVVTAHRELAAFEAIRDRHARRAVVDHVDLAGDPLRGRRRPAAADAATAVATTAPARIGRRARTVLSLWTGLPERATPSACPGYRLAARASAAPLAVIAGPGSASRFHACTLSPHSGQASAGSITWPQSRCRRRTAGPSRSATSGCPTSSARSGSRRGRSPCG